MTDYNAILPEPQPENYHPLESYLTNGTFPRSALESWFAYHIDEFTPTTLYERLSDADLPFGEGEVEEFVDVYGDDCGESWEYDNMRKLAEAARMARSGPYVKTPISSKIRWAIFRRDGYKCVLCDSLEDLTADHVIAEVNGGPTVIENLRTLCRPCNSRKGAR